MYVWVSLARFHEVNRNLPSACIWEDITRRYWGRRSAAHEFWGNRTALPIRLNCCLIMTAITSRNLLWPTRRHGLKVWGLAITSAELCIGPCPADSHSQLVSIFRNEFTNERFADFKAFEKF